MRIIGGGEEKTKKVINTQTKIRSPKKNGKTK